MPTWREKLETAGVEEKQVVVEPFPLCALLDSELEYLKIRKQVQEWLMGRIEKWLRTGEK